MNELVPSLIVSWMLAIGLALCAYLFVSVKQEMRRVENRHKRQTEELAKSLQETRDETESLRALMKELDQRTGALPQLSPPRPGMNTTRRSQVLRMFRRGEQPQQIAAALNLSQGEVDLLLKVHLAAERS